MIVTKRKTEIRRLNDYEIVRLVYEADSCETYELFRVINRTHESIPEFFAQREIEASGIITDERPIYMAFLTYNYALKRHVLWTVVNQNVKEQKTLYKYSKIVSYQWANKYGEIYATMTKLKPQNIRWTMKLGFEIVESDRYTVTLRLKGG